MASHATSELERKEITLVKRFAFNDMLGKGWDSAKQESFCWQQFVENGGSQEPGSQQFWWVPRVWELHGHAWNWEGHTRDESGKFVSFPSEGPQGEGSDTEANVAVRLLRLATTFSTKDQDKAKQLISVASLLCGEKFPLE